jgi:hypothetical protein
VDRQEGAAVGVYAGTVGEQYVPYVVPQENANKTEVRWAAFTAEDGTGLLLTGAPWFGFSALHYTTQDLETAAHSHEVHARPEITLNVDHKQSGLGSASCGPGTLDAYLIHPETWSYRLRLRPFSAGEGATKPGTVAEAVKLSKQPPAS